jgi:hypothetical protein
LAVYEAACEAEFQFAIASSNAIPISVADGVRPVNSSNASCRMQRQDRSLTI